MRKKLADLGPVTLRYNSIDVSQVIFELTFKVYTQFEPLFSVSGDLDTEKDLLWLPYRDEYENLDDLMAKGIKLSIESPKHKFDIMGLVPSNDHNYYGILNLKKV